MPGSGSGQAVVADGLVLVLPEPLGLAEGGHELVEPGRLVVVLGEERTLHPVGVAALDEAQYEHLLASDLGDALDLDLARTGAHARATRGAGQTGYLLHGLAIDLPGAHQRHFEVRACAGV